VYLPSVGKYYRAIFELVDWNTARNRCSDLGPRSRLVDINNARESAAVQGLIASFDGNSTCFSQSALRNGLQKEFRKLNISLFVLDDVVSFAVH